MASVIRWRLCADSAGSGGPGRRPPRADHSRCAARERTSNSASSGSSRISNVASVGGSLSHSRCVVPPNRTTACHPSDARRSSAPVSLVRSRLVPTSINRRTNSRRQHGRQNLGRPEDGLRIEGLAGVSCEKKAPIALGIFPRSAQPATRHAAASGNLLDSRDCDEDTPRRSQLLRHSAGLHRPPAISNRIPTSYYFPHA